MAYKYTLWTYLITLKPYRGGLFRQPIPLPDDGHPDIDWLNLVQNNRTALVGDWCDEENFARWDGKGRSCGVWLVTEEWLCRQMRDVHRFRLTDTRSRIQLAQWRSVR